MRVYIIYIYYNDMNINAVRVGRRGRRVAVTDYGVGELCVRTNIGLRSAGSVRRMSCDRF